ncbi:MAG: glycosyltransferase [Oscillatoriales cyanobacterium C42_A2020_001]|nr:glycosyltransferase [Leptolyngbyaceae cyanobacterium C42_A2020_001]
MNPKLLSLLITPMTGNGGDRVVLNLSQAFVELGYTVDLVAPEVTEYHRSVMKTLPPQIRTVDFGLPVSPTIYFKKLFKLKRYLEETEPLVLLANGDYVGLANAAKKIARSQTKIIQVVHVSVSHYFGKASSFRTKAKYFLLKHFYRSSDGIVAVSQGVAHDLAKLINIPPDQIQTIYNPIVTSDLLEKAKAPIDHPWFAPGEPPVILGAGRLHPQKDFATLIRAFAKLRQQRPARLLIIGGEPAQKEILQNLIKELHLEEDVQLFGFTDNPYAFMARADVFALSSRYEGFGNVLVEAMATGTPVVSTDCESGPAEILEQGKYGKLVPVENHEALAEAILTTINEQIDIEALRKRAQEFTDIESAKQYLQLINRFSHQSILV